MKKKLPATVVALGVVSLLTDASGEMIYPLLPAFLASLHASAAFIGAVDGVAETVSAFMKLASGLWSDRVKQKRIFVWLGYGLASVVRPLVALARAPWQVLVIRATDRVGKGLRSSPRDAIIAGAVGEDQRGRAFGFHQGMDHVGAIIGPLIAWLLHDRLGWAAATVFGISAIPAAGAIVSLFFVREPPAPPAASAETKPALIGEPLPAQLRYYLVVLAIFTLGNSSDLFLLLRVHDAGVPTSYAPLLWALIHVVKATLSEPLGSLSDRIGRKRVILAGWGVYALVYLGFAFVASAWQAWALFLIYGAYYAFTEGAEKALIADLAPKSARGRAFGWYNFIIGIAALPASVGFGWIYDHVGHATAFFVSAGLAAAAAVGLTAVRTPHSRQGK